MNQTNVEFTPSDGKDDSLETVFPDTVRNHQQKWRRTFLRTAHIANRRLWVMNH